MSETVTISRSLYLALLREVHIVRLALKACPDESIWDVFSCGAVGGPPLADAVLRDRLIEAALENERNTVDGSS